MVQLPSTCIGPDLEKMNENQIKKSMSEKQTDEIITEQKTNRDETNKKLGPTSSSGGHEGWGRSVGGLEMWSSLKTGVELS